jgi:mono/diheme cytochrome c family protein
MTNKSARPSPLAPLGGVVVGIAVFLGVNITSGRAVIPTRESVVNEGRLPISRTVRPTETAVAEALGPYQAVCATCHQAEGQGMPGVFPPLAGSEWMTGNPEVPIRITLLGLTGPIDVKGVTYNAMMPPPPGLSDEQIAEAITFARTNFGNQASEVTVDQVQEVRAALGGRTEPFRAEELKPLLSGGAAEGEQGAAEGAEGAAEGAEGAAEGEQGAAPAPEQPPPPAAP